MKAEADALIERVLEGALLLAIGNDGRRIAHALHKVVHILQARELGRDQPEHDRLVRGKVLQRLERARARCVVLEVVAVHIDLLEQLNRNPVVTALAEIVAVLHHCAGEYIDAI